MSDDREAFRRVCNEYLRQYHSAKVPAPRLDEETVQQDGVRVVRQWSRTPPTTAGWYWVWDGYEVWACQFFEHEGAIVHRLDSSTYEPAQHTGTHWLGPVPVPAPRLDDEAVQRDGVKVAATCHACGKPIAFDGTRWHHTHGRIVRHIATPDGCYDTERTFAGRYMGDLDETGDVQIVAADLLAAIERGDLLVITPGNDPDAVREALQRMFSDAEWWKGFLAGVTA